MKANARESFTRKRSGNAIALARNRLSRLAKLHMYRKRACSPRLERRKVSENRSERREGKRKKDTQVRLEFPNSRSDKRRAMTSDEENTQCLLSLFITQRYGLGGERADGNPNVNGISPIMPISNNQCRAQTVSLELRHYGNDEDVFKC